MRFPSWIWEKGHSNSVLMKLYLRETPVKTISMSKHTDDLDITCFHGNVYKCINYSQILKPCDWGARLWIEKYFLCKHLLTLSAALSNSRWDIHNPSFVRPKLIDQEVDTVSHCVYWPTGSAEARRKWPIQQYFTRRRKWLNKVNRKGSYENGIDPNTTHPNNRLTKVSDSW